MTIKKKMINKLAITGEKGAVQTIDTPLVFGHGLLVEYKISC
jgi:hypothetical protein